MVVVCVQTRDTYLSAYKLHHLFLSSVQVFQKQIVRLQIGISTSGKLIFPSLCTHTMLQQPHVFW